jgi:hypothetical protein
MKLIKGESRKHFSSIRVGFNPSSTEHLLNTSSIPDATLQDANLQLGRVMRHVAETVDNGLLGRKRIVA